MSQSGTFRAVQDAWVDHDVPNANHGGGTRLRMRSDATGHGQQSFVHLKPPFRHGSTILSAEVRVRRNGDWGASHPIKIRRVSDPWKENRVTWNNRPASDAASEITITVPAGDDNEEITLDVTPLYVDVSAGDDYSGLRFDTGDDTELAFYSAESPKQGTTPKLDVTWTQAPYPPSNLTPSGGGAVNVASPVLGFRFSDDTGSTKQGSSRVQISATNDFSGALLYDSLKQANTRHEWPLAGHYALADGQTVWWRVMVWDRDDFASGWSNAVSFRRELKGTLEILSPIPPVDVVEDLTPVILFAYTGGGTLERVALVLNRVKPDGSLVRLYEFKEQAIEPTFNAITIPPNLIHSGPTFRAGVKAWDDVDRVATPGDHAYAFEQVDFSYVRDGGPAKVDTLTAVPTAYSPDTIGTPFVRLTWTRSTVPDYFTLVVDGIEVLHRIVPEDVATLNAGEYTMDFWRAVSDVPHDYEVEAVVASGGVRRNSNSNSIAHDVVTHVAGKWLVDEDDSTAVQIAAEGEPQTPGFEIGESTDVKFPVGGRRPVLRTDSIRGDEGGFAGVLKSSAEADTFLDLKGRMKPLRYLQQRKNMPIRLGQVACTPRASRSGKDWWNVTGEAFQIDEYFHVAGE